MDLLASQVYLQLLVVPLKHLEYCLRFQLQRELHHTLLPVDTPFFHHQLLFWFPSSQVHFYMIYSNTILKDLPIVGCVQFRQHMSNFTKSFLPFHRIQRTEFQFLIQHLALLPLVEVYQIIIPIWLIIYKKYRILTKTYEWSFGAEMTTLKLMGLGISI